MAEETKAKAKVLWEGSLKTTSIVREFEVHSDKPKSYLGTNTAPAPLEIFISGMGSCFLTSFVYAAMKSRVEVGDVAVDIKAFTGGKEDRERILNGEVKLKVWGNAEDEKKLRKCFDIAKASCPMTNGVNFPLEMTFEFKAE